MTKYRRCSRVIDFGFSVRRTMVLLKRGRWLPLPAARSRDLLPYVASYLLVFYLACQFTLPSSFPFPSSHFGIFTPKINSQHLQFDAMSDLNPPNELEYDTREIAEAAIQKNAKQQGYAVPPTSFTTTKRASKTYLQVYNGSKVRGSSHPAYC